MHTTYTCALACVYVCIRYARMYTCMYICMYERMYVRMYVCIHIACMLNRNLTYNEANQVRSYLNLLYIYFFVIYPIYT